MRKYVAIFVLTLSALYAEVEMITLTRADGSILEGYLSRPEMDDNATVHPYSLLIHIQDASPTSIYSAHMALQEKALKMGLALLTLEKRGISKDHNDLDDYAHHNFLEERVQDYSQCLDYCRGMIGWDGNIVLLSHSAGGIVAAQLTQELSNVQALLLLATGGGLPRLEEFHYAACKESTHFEDHEGALADADATWEEILSHPVDDRYLANRSYRWWAHVLTAEPFLNTLLRLDIPIYLVHGTEDITLPIESADRLAEAFQQHGKTNLIYHRLEGYNHALMQPQVLDNALQWLSELGLSVHSSISLSDWTLQQFFDSPHTMCVAKKDSKEEKHENKSHGDDQQTYYRGKLKGSHNERTSQQSADCELEVYRGNTDRWWKTGVGGGIERDAQGKTSEYVVVEVTVGY